MTDEQIVEALRAGRSVGEVARLTHRSRWKDLGERTRHKRVSALGLAAGVATIDQAGGAADRRTRLAELVNGSEVQPITIRQAFYMAVSAKLTEKDNTSYHRVIRDLIRLRLEGVVPWSAIEDRHRRVDVGEEDTVDRSDDPQDSVIERGCRPTPAMLSRTRIRDRRRHHRTGRLSRSTPLDPIRTTPYLGSTSTACRGRCCSARRTP